MVYAGPSPDRESTIVDEFPMYTKLLAGENLIPVEWGVDSLFPLNGKRLNIDEFLQVVKADNGIILNATSGEFGEDGWFQERMALAQIPYTGPTASAAMLSLNKFTSQLAVADFVSIPKTYSTILKDLSIADLELNLGKGFPIFAKPLSSGYSIGTEVIHNPQELEALVAKYPEAHYLLQEFVTGREFAVGVIRDGKGGFLDLPVTEIKPNDEFYSVKAKHSAEGAVETTPADIDSELRIRLVEMARKVHDRLGMGFCSRTDCILQGDRLVYLECNSIPGMGEKSLLPIQMRVINYLEKLPFDMLAHPIDLIKKSADRLCKPSTDDRFKPHTREYITGLTLDELCINIQNSRANYLELKDGTELCIYGYNLPGKHFMTCDADGNEQQMDFDALRSISAYKGWY